MIREERIFKIVANMALNNERRDAVRLYDNVPSKIPTSNLDGEVDPLQDDSLVNYRNVLKVSEENSSVPTTFKNVENDQIYQQRVQEFRYKGQNSVLVFVQNVTNIQKLQQLEA